LTDGANGPIRGHQQTPEGNQMRKHEKLGYSRSDVADFRTWKNTRNSRRGLIFTYLDGAADYRRMAANPFVHSSTSFYRYDDFMRFAKGQLIAAHDWRVLTTQ
jgi:hypothetical protein